jgi:hypothetical protein
MLFLVSGAGLSAQAMSAVHMCILPVPPGSSRTLEAGASDGAGIRSGHSDCRNMTEGITPVTVLMQDATTVTELFEGAFHK